MVIGAATVRLRVQARARRASEEGLRRAIPRLSWSGLHSIGLKNYLFCLPDCKVWDRSQLLEARVPILRRQPLMSPTRTASAGVLSGAHFGQSSSRLPWSTIVAMDPIVFVRAGAACFRSCGSAPQTPHEGRPRQPAPDRANAVPCAKADGVSTCHGSVFTSGTDCEIACCTFGRFQRGSL